MTWHRHFDVEFNIGNWVAMIGSGHQWFESVGVNGWNGQQVGYKSQRWL